MSLELLIDLLAYLEPILWLKNTVLDKNQKDSQNFILTISDQTLTSHILAAD